MITPHRPLTVCGTCKMVSESGAEVCEECGGYCTRLAPTRNHSEYVAMGDFARPSILAASTGPLLLPNHEPVTDHAQEHEGT